MSKTLRISEMTILLIIIFINNSFCQIETQWINHYDFANRGENGSFEDIFATTDGGYALCGFSINEGRNDLWAAKITADGELEWSRIYGGQDHDRALSLIQDDEGGYVIVGYVTQENGNAEIAVLRTDAQGDTLWMRYYGDGSASAVIELKSGEFMVCGIHESDGFLLQVDANGELLWMEIYGGDNREGLTAMRETEGGIVASGYEWVDGTSSHYIIKTDFEGELLWEHYYDIGQAGNIMASGMTSCRVGGFVLTGKIWNNGEQGIPFLLRIDADGNQLWSHYYLIDPGEQVNTGCGAYNVIEMQDGGLILACSGASIWEALLIRTDGQGNVVWRFSENFGENQRFCRFRSLVVNANGEITAAGEANYADTGYDGLVVKFLEEDLQRLIVSYSPEDLSLEVLPGERIDFIVQAEPLVEDTITYFWMLDNDTVGVDTSFTFQFDESDDHQLTCVVSNGGFIDSVAWSIGVDEFKISDFLPDDLNLRIQRGSTVQFSLAVESLENINPEFLWTLTDRSGNQSEIGTMNSVDVEFLQTGNHSLEGRVLHGEDVKSIVWTIESHSVVWWWWPHDLELSVRQDTAIAFEVYPFNEESDSIDYSWYLNDEVIDSDTSVVGIPFPHVGANEISVYVREGAETDTIRWTVEVVEIQSADYTDYADFPSSPVLYPAAPNPFNSSVNLSMYLPKTNHVLLSILDINGREVKRLIDGSVEAGSQAFMWNADDFPAGVYVVRMNAGNVSEIMKVVLVR